MAMPSDSASALAAVICEPPAREARVHHAHRHSLRNVVQRHRQHHHGRAPQLAFRPLRLVAPHMKVGNQTIQHEQKQHADPKADHGGKEGQPAHPLRLLNRGNQQTQIDAATITPAAKPASERRTKSPSDFFIKNTHAAPSVVPRNGIRIPRKVSKFPHRLFAVFDLVRFPADKPGHAFHVSNRHDRIHVFQPIFRLKTVS